MLHARWADRCRRSLLWVLRAVGGEPPSNWRRRVNVLWRRLLGRCRKINIKNKSEISQPTLRIWFWHCHMLFTPYRPGRSALHLVGINKRMSLRLDKKSISTMYPYDIHNFVDYNSHQVRFSWEWKPGIWKETTQTISGYKQAIRIIKLAPFYILQTLRFPLRSWHVSPLSWQQRFWGTVSMKFNQQLRQTRKQILNIYIYIYIYIKPHTHTHKQNKQESIRLIFAVP